MSKSSHVELDFFGLHNLANSMAHPPQPQTQPQPQPQPRLDRRQSFRGIAKINPEIVKSVIASANASKSSSSHPGTPTSSLGMSQLPLFHPNPFSGEDSMEKAEETAPMTIFYNGSVSVYDLPNDKAESIMKLAMEKNESKNEGKVVDYSCFKSSQATTKNILGRLNDDDGDDSDMPIKRKKSLQRFFEKRKERLVSPYTNIEHMASGIEQQKA
ncbi:hypothetical protein SOVF_102830 [Spinacia oleracea]|nr:hypothetical protein SOVF_102830 [Spinacia oleracea]